MKSYKTKRRKKSEKNISKEVKIRRVSEKKNETKQQQQQQQHETITFTSYLLFSIVCRLRKFITWET